jgi:methyl-accepting chemotaxis protein
VVEETFAEQGIHLVNKAVSLIDGNSFETLAKSRNLNDPYYEETRIKLLELKEASSCIYLYTMSQVSGNIWQFVIDGSADPSDTENFSALGDEEDVSDYDNAFNRALSSGKTESGEIIYQEGWGWLVSIYTPIKNSAGKTVGIAACDFDGTHLHNSILTVQKRQVIIGGVSIILGIVLMLFILQLLFPRLQKINSILKEISLGEGDLTMRINVDKEDEIGELSNYFNLTIEKIKKLVRIIKNKVNALTNTSYELSLNLTKTSKAIDRISVDFADMRSLEVK